MEIENQWIVFFGETLGLLVNENRSVNNTLKMLISVCDFNLKVERIVNIYQLESW